MKYEGEETLREELRQYLMIGGHGAIRKLADASGLSEATITRMNNDEPVKKRTLVLIRNGLMRLGHSIEFLDEAVPLIQTKDTLLLVADVLKAVIDTIHAEDISRPSKARITMNQLKILISEYGRKLVELGEEGD